MSVARAKIDILSRNISYTLDTFDRSRLKRKLVKCKYDGNVSLK